MNDRTMVMISHPDLGITGPVPRSALAHMAGWNEVEHPEKSSRPMVESHPDGTAATAASPNPAAVDDGTETGPEAEDNQER